MDFNPLDSKVLARQFKSTKEKTESGIILPESAQDKDSDGTVRALVMKVGSDVPAPGDSDDAKNFVEEGDTIVMPAHLIHMGVKIEGKPYILVDRMDISAIEEKGNNS